LQPPSLDRRAACAPRSYPVDSTKSSESGLHMYVDMHGHASKRGNSSVEFFKMRITCYFIEIVLVKNNVFFDILRF
jgi:hypothetical protein